MILLNEKNLLSLTRKLASREIDSPYPPMIVEYRHSIVVTDGGLLIEWVKDRIDPRNEVYQKLLQVGQKQSKANPLREVAHWSEFVTPSNQFHEAEEVDPEEGDLAGCMAYLCEGQRFLYRVGYVEAMEWALEVPPRFKCNLPEANENLAILCPFSGKVPAGAIANEIIHHA